MCEGADHPDCSIDVLEGVHLICSMGRVSLKYLQV